MQKAAVLALVWAPVFMMSVPAPARAEWTIGPTVAYVTPEGASRGVLGLGVLAGFPRLGDRWNLDATLAYWSESEGLSDVSDLSTGVRIMRHFVPAESPVDVAIGAGPSLHVQQSEFDAPGETRISDASNRFGFDIAGELGVPLNDRLELVFQSVYTIVSEDVGLDGGSANSHFSIGAGLLFYVDR